MDLLLIHVKHPEPRIDWKPGDIVYYWDLGKIHKAVFCRWTVGDHLWAAVFDIWPQAEAADKDGYDYRTERVTYDDLFADRNELAALVTKEVFSKLINLEE